MPAEVRGRIPKGLELVQTNFAVGLPAGAVVAFGVEIAAAPEG